MSESKGVVTYYALRIVGNLYAMEDCIYDTYEEAVSCRDFFIENGRFDKHQLEIVRVEQTPV